MRAVVECAAMKLIRVEAEFEGGLVELRHNGAAWQLRTETGDMIEATGLDGREKSAERAQAEAINDFAKALGAMGRK